MKHYILALLAGLFLSGAAHAQTTFGAAKSPGLNVFGLPVGATPANASATGTTLATTATLAGVAGQNTYICGFRIYANAAAAATGNATITGVAGGTLNFTQFTAANTTSIGSVTGEFLPCLQSTGPNTSIAVVSATPGSGGVVSVTAWGYNY